MRQKSHAVSAWRVIAGKLEPERASGHANQIDILEEIYFNTACFLRFLYESITVLIVLENRLNLGSTVGDDIHADTDLGMDGEVVGKEVFGANTDINGKLIALIVLKVLCNI